MYRVTVEGPNPSTLDFPTYEEAASYVSVIYDTMDPDEADATSVRIRSALPGDTVVDGNPDPEGAPLHEQMSDDADHLHYEADVVEAAAEETDNDDIADAAEDQADAMHDAADALEDAAEAARETAAEVFVETEVIAAEVDEIAADAVADSKEIITEVTAEPDADIADLEGAADDIAEVIETAVDDIKKVEGVTDAEAAEVGEVIADVVTDIAPEPRHWYKRNLLRG